MRVHGPPPPNLPPPSVPASEGQKPTVAASELLRKTLGALQQPEDQPAAAIKEREADRGRSGKQPTTTSASETGSITPGSSTGATGRVISVIA